MIPSISIIIFVLASQCWAQQLGHFVQNSYCDGTPELNEVYELIDKIHFWEYSCNDLPITLELLKNEIVRKFQGILYTSHDLNLHRPTRDNAAWGAWASTNCSVSCGDGFIVRTRACLNEPGCNLWRYRGRNEFKKCSNDPCPGDSVNTPGQKITAWTAWVQNGICSASCDGGVVEEIRSCINGPGCVGDSTREVQCNLLNCSAPPTWSSWSGGGSCGRSCGRGIYRVYRSCLLGSGCVGRNSEYRLCNTQPCPGRWGSFTPFSACSVTCGQGIRTSSRICYGRIPCIGPTMRAEPCYKPGCRRWSPWIKVGLCRSSCVNGERQEIRICFNGPGCRGPSNRTIACNLKQCGGNCKGGLIYNNKCIRLPYTTGIDMNFTEADKLCKATNGNLVEVINDLMFRRVYFYVKYRWRNHLNFPNSYDIFVWLGSTYQSDDNPGQLVTLSNGERVQLEWRREYPNSDASWGLLRMNVIVLTRSLYRGIMNTPTYEYAIPVCSYDLP